MTPLSLNRRVFLQNGTLILAGVMSGQYAAAETAPPKTPLLRIGLLTDIHYAEKEPNMNRYYKESLAKVAAAAEQWKDKPLNFIVELGDLIDSVKKPETDKHHLRTINRSLSQISKQRYYVLGNHCVETLTKDEFLNETGQEKSFFSFDESGYHFIVLDACFRQDDVPYGLPNHFDWKDTKIPDAELEWLRADLAASKLPAVVFLHQRLDINNQEACAVKNSDVVRKVLEASGTVRLVLQGHHHPGGFSQINGIAYCTLQALIEGSGENNNSFSLLEIDSDNEIRLTGFVKQKSYDLKKQSVLR